ncbi:MAG: polyamine aminopropyltransferase [Candidatus Kapabacteria bacterium]|nr:polyamine aminopropyltransferase [Candidatus Kapabacteria bacterium]MDW8011600.1 polyamine aminopropyltransferase [Bacteroidota bacterium]
MSGELRYAEYFSARAGVTTDVEAILYDGRSSHQRITVLLSPTFGRMLLLDGAVMVTEWDEFIYHETLVHPALFLLPQPRKVLVVGGGDGGSVREILRHPSVEGVDVVEIDEEVVRVARRFLPTVASCLGDPRVRIYYQDGAQFVAERSKATYDVVIVDAPDPIGIGGSLFTETFYQHCWRILRSDGVLVLQSGSPLHPAYREALPRVQGTLQTLFRHVAPYWAPVPTYPTGIWTFTIASRRWHPTKDYDLNQAWGRYRSLAGKLRYYTPELHTAAFALPAFIVELLGLAASEVA